MLCGVFAYFHVILCCLEVSLIFFILNYFQCTVRAIVSGFSKTMISHLFKKDYLLGSEENSLTDAIRLQVCETPSHGT